MAAFIFPAALSVRPASFSPLPFALRKLPLLTALACGAVLTVQAQPVVQLVAAKALQEVVVSGSRHEQAMDELPMSMDVINATDIEQGQIRDIRDAAKNLPNVSVKRAPARFGLIGGSGDGRDGNAGFNIRGLDGNRVLLLVDGIRAPRSYVFSSYAFGRDSFSVDLLKRIEIVRGPASVLYGSDGLAGLVNFITHEPADFLTEGKNLGGRASIGYSGDNEGVTLGATLAGRANESLEWLVSASQNRGKALDNMGTNAAANVDRTRPNPQSDRGNALLAKVVLKPSSAQKHVLTLERVEKKSDYDLLTTRAKPPLVAASVLKGNALTTAERTRLTWDARYKVDSLLADNLQTVLSYQEAASRQYTYEDRNTAADRVRDMTYDERTLQAGIQADKTIRLTPDWAQKITYGFDYVRADIINLQTGIGPTPPETFPLKRFPDTTESSSAIYVQDEFISDHWSITPGVRVDRFKLDASQAGFTARAASLSGSAVSPKLGVLFRATPEWSVFGNYASGFRAPNAGQLNGFFENVNQFYKTISNPDLKPEKSKNFEVGVRGRLNALTLDVAAFTGRFNNLIEDNATVGGAGVFGNPTVFQSINVGNATISGFEIKGAMDWGKLADGRLSTPFSYGETRGKDRATGRPLNSIDPAKLHVGVKYATAVWDVRLDASRHSGKKASDVYVKAPATQFVVPAATTLDLSGQWRINKKLRLNASIVNLTDKKYWNWSDVRGQAVNAAAIDAYTQPGRHFNVSLVADF
ncbi:TonB-dependent hemoglobin/transferrin/lactoferrin family receptor [Polaromonas sp. SM01]|uniref:TonB-dependent hemoglobin/transferrin/lactoferrin family receptor n=1 Tax=Polaromonas sp. SM01 TaxID=3085630 RepID=UPI002982280F|nr:TonB-dependent hemoglobin/transferrin/lactoferrin family receptor [Polaromonas sp. SM01]MDW5441934.1 TonB-dependent hemoglobin/transferrin/lactoferrin family receptor [Polaromonas sp. SM01]